MKTLELNQMETIQGGDFWDGLCGSMSIASGAGFLAIEIGLVASIPGLNVVAGVAAIGCGIAAL